MRGELLTRLPVHEGDTLMNDSIAKVAAAAREFDEHLVVGTRFAGGEATITITAPNYSPTAAMDVNTSGPKLIRQPRPVYPQEAKEARISGVVKLRAIIAADGTVKKLEMISGHPLLAPAAFEAVQHWVYQPTLVNGSPVEVSTEISVSFTLSE
jgi:TonB family protein